MPKTDRAAFDLIVDNATFIEWCDHHRASRFFAIDTEFERSRTYFAQLCLLQVASEDAIAVVDPQAGIDLSYLFGLLHDSGGETVIHAARQDLEVLHFAGLKQLNRLVDTQIAAALAGYSEQIGYAQLVKELLGAELDKSETRTDWRARPLSERQLEYAADDVRYLGAVWQALAERLDNKNRLDWLRQDCAGLMTTDLLDPPLEQAWNRVKGLKRLHSAAFARGVDIAAWREQTAQARDLPRSWVLKDAAIVELALKRPRDKTEMAALESVEPQQLRRDAEALLDVLEAATSDAQTPAPPNNLSPEERQHVKQLAQKIGQRAEQLGIAQSCLASRREIEAMVGGSVPARFIAGWRAAQLGDLISPYMP